MSYQMIHMEVAYRLLEQIPLIENAAEFILGSVAPDCVHMNPDYNVAIKITGDGITISEAIFVPFLPSRKEQITETSYSAYVFIA